MSPRKYERSEEEVSVITLLVRFSLRMRKAVELGMFSQIESDACAILLHDETFAFFLSFFLFY